MSIAGSRNDAWFDASGDDGDALPLSQRLRLDQIPDWEFDEIYSPPVRYLSSMFWTPVSVAVRAAELLVIDRSTRVLDVGSGVGKFCIVGAAVTGARFTGVEQRENLVRIAQRTAERLGVDGASFVHGTFDAMRVEEFDAFYFFNPFQENVFGSDDRIDETVELCHERFIGDVERAESLLVRAAVGTRVVTYHGFGGKMPPAYRQLRRERRRSGYLELWVKDDAPPSPCP